MLSALWNRVLANTGPRRNVTVGLPIKSPKINSGQSRPNGGNTVLTALDEFFRSERSHAAHTDLFASLVERFASNHPIESHVKRMFDAFLAQIISPLHQSVFWGDRMLTLDKAASFLKEETFCRSYQTIRGSHVYDAYDSPYTIAWRLHTLVWAAKSSLAWQGDLVECGVFKGDMSWVVATTLGNNIKDRTFYLYDSFEGFSPKLSSATDFPDHPGFFEMANNIYRDPTNYEFVVQRFANMPHVKIIRGFIPESFKIRLPERIVFLHIDLNSPAAEIAALEQLFERVVRGGYIVFDDYGWKQFAKQREAEDRFMANHGHSILELPTGQGLVIKQ